jgi:hypothetical protein
MTSKPSHVSAAARAAPWAMTGRRREYTRARPHGHCQRSRRDAPCRHQCPRRRPAGAAMSGSAGGLNRRLSRAAVLQMTTITKPIIIVGTGRCGSTVFHRVLARHPNVMWLSGFCDHYPTRPEWNRARLWPWGIGLHRLLAGKIQPGECYHFWDRHTFGFSEPCRDLVRGDVTARVKKQVRGVMGTMLTPSRPAPAAQDHWMAPAGLSRGDLR